MNRNGNWLQTYTGIPFYPLDPQPKDFNIKDIAHALSNLCRFGGHSIHFYSAAQHSCLVSQLVPTKFGLWGLLHDASEAYLVDIPNPIKNYLPDYCNLENACIMSIAKAFNLEFPMPEEIHYADLAALKLEREYLMTFSPQCVWQIDDIHIDLPWYDKDYTKIEINPCKPIRAEQKFLERYYYLCKNQE